MTEESKLSMRAAKISHIIMNLCDLYGISLPAATDMFYKSATADMIEEGVAELQCRSNKYLASLIWDEYQKEKVIK